MMQFRRLLSGIHIKKQDLLIDAFKFLIFFLCVLSFFALIYSAVNIPDEAIAYLYLLLLPASLSFLCARIPLKLWQMSLWQSLLVFSTLIMLFFRPFYESIFAIIMMFLIATVSMTSRYRYRERTSVTFEVLGASLTIHIIILGLCACFPSGNLSYVILAHALICICLFFAARQKYAFESSYGHIVNSPTQPSGQVKRLNKRIVILLFIFSLAVIPITVYFPYSILSSLFIILLRWITNGIKAIYYFLERLNILPEITEADAVPDIPKETTESNNKAYEIFQNVLMIIMIAALCLLVFILVRKFIRFLISSYRRVKPDKTSGPTDLIQDEVISLEKKRVKRFRKIDFGKGKEKEVRKQYYKSVKREIRSGAVVTASQTPNQIGQAIKNSSGNDFTELTIRYEHIRYGNEEDKHS